MKDEGPANRIGVIRVIRGSKAFLVAAGGGRAGISGLVSDFGVRPFLKQRIARITQIEEEFFASIRGIRVIRGSKAFWLRPLAAVRVFWESWCGWGTSEACVSCWDAAADSADAQGRIGAAAPPHHVLRQAGRMPQTVSPGRL
jgi:hypothetical protein